jgi:hypothetical protein
VLPHGDPTSGTARGGGAVGVETSEAWADSLRGDLATRTTQTNEIGRAGAVVVGLSQTVPHDGRSIALLELGASAGLLLACDRYRIRFDRRVVHGPAESPVTIEVAGRGERPPDRPHPPIAWRRGVDLTPLDVADPAQRGWLEACCWADDLERFDRLRAALDLVTPDPPVVESGDALAELPRLLRAAPERHHLVVMNAWALTYLTPARREAVGKIIAGAGRDRDLTWLSIESPAQTPELPRPPDPLRRPGATDLIAVSARAGQIEVARLAELHPHGRWIDWMARRHPAGPDRRSGNDDDLDPTIQRSPFGGGIAGYR